MQHVCRGIIPGRDWRDGVRQLHRWQLLPPWRVGADVIALPRTLELGKPRPGFGELRAEQRALRPNVGRLRQCGGGQHGRELLAKAQRAQRLLRVLLLAAHIDHDARARRPIERRAQQHRQRRVSEAHVGAARAELFDDAAEGGERLVDVGSRGAFARSL